MDPTLNLKTRYEQIEDVASYAKDLPEDAKEWLNKFVGEYVNTSFNKDRSLNLQKSDQERRSCYKLNNDRNKDLYTKGKACGKAYYLEDIMETMKTKQINSEDELIETLDSLDITDDFENRYDDGESESD